MFSIITNNEGVALIIIHYSLSCDFFQIGLELLMLILFSFLLLKREPISSSNASEKGMLVIT